MRRAGVRSAKRFFGATAGVLLAGAALGASGGSTQAQASAYVSIPALIAGHGYDGSTLGTGRSGQPMSVDVDFGAAPEGSTSQLVAVGRPGSTPDPSGVGTAIMDEANQITVEQSFEATALVVRFRPVARGTYPVFVFSSGDLGCASASMQDETINFRITQVGVVDIR